MGLGLRTRLLFRLGAGAAIVGLAATAADAGTVPVRFTEGVARGFLVLRSQDGERLAHGELSQRARGDRVESRLVFRFADGSLYDETVVFSQRDVFRLLRYRLVQRGPSFPDALDASFDRERGRYTVRYRTDDDSEEEVVEGEISLPDDVYNGILSTLLKNLDGHGATIQMVTFTPRPRVISIRLEPVSHDAVVLADLPMRATRYLIKPQLGVFASFLVADPAPMQSWILEDGVPTFLKFEGPLYFLGPVWRIELN